MSRLRAAALLLVAVAALLGICGGALQNLGARLGTPATAHFVSAAEAEGGGGLTRVFRVESPGNARLDVSTAGDVAVKGDNMLFLNFGDEARAGSFLARRLGQGYEGSVIKSFQVPSSYADALRASSVPERLAGQFPGSPLMVDIGQAADQFGLRASHFDELIRNIVPGSGGVWP